MRYYIEVEYVTKNGVRASRFATVTASNEASAKSIAKGLTLGLNSARINLQLVDKSM